MTTLAIDYGQRHLGLAISFDGKVSHQLETLNHLNLNEAVKRLEGIIRVQKVQQIVLGLPLGAQGETGRSSQKIKGFGQFLKAKFKLPIFYQNETLTSWQARQRMGKVGISRQKRSLKEHAFAAQIILQDFLTSK